MSVRSTAMRPRNLATLAAARRSLRLCERHGRRVVLDRRLAVRAHLPERLEWPVAVRARLAQLRRADRTDQELLLDLRAAYRAMQVAAAEPLLHRLDLELALADVVEVFGRPEQHVDQRPDEGHDADRGHDPDDQRILDAPARV